MNDPINPAHVPVRPMSVHFSPFAVQLAPAGGISGMRPGRTEGDWQILVTPGIAIAGALQFSLVGLVGQALASPKPPSGSSTEASPKREPPS